MRSLLLQNPNPNPNPTPMRVHKYKSNAIVRDRCVRHAIVSFHYFNAGHDFLHAVLFTFIFVRCDYFPSVGSRHTTSRHHRLPIHGSFCFFAIFFSRALFFRLMKDFIVRFVFCCSCCCNTRREMHRNKQNKKNIFCAPADSVDFALHLQASSSRQRRSTRCALAQMEWNNRWILFLVRTAVGNQFIGIPSAHSQIDVIN